AAGVEDRGRGEHPFPVRVQERRVIGLRGQDEEAEREHEYVRHEHGERVLLPALRAGIERALDAVGRRAVEHAGHVEAQRDRQADHQDDRENWQEPHRWGPFRGAIVILPLSALARGWGQRSLALRAQTSPPRPLSEAERGEQTQTRTSPASAGPLATSRTGTS